jgi:hypothetical protein
VAVCATLLLAGAFLLSAAPANSISGGIDSGPAGVGLGAERGCYCHSDDGASKTPNGNAQIIFLVSGLEGGYFQPSAKYDVNLTFVEPLVPISNVSGANHGGFNVWASGGTFEVNGSNFVRVNTDGSITHTLEGDRGAYRSFQFVWTAPASNASDVTFDILVNAVNGDNTNGGGHDKWSRTQVVLPGQPGASTGEVDISALGVPLRAYWLGVIGILATMVLVLLSFYVIRSGSKFYEFGLPRGEVKNVKIRTIPPPRNKGAFVVLAALILIDVAIVLTFISSGDAAMDAFQLSLFLIGFFAVLAMAFAYYVRAFLPIVDVMEEETVEPMR